MVREARLLSLVDHPALPQLVRVGNDAHGPFFLETFISGTSLRELVRGWFAQDKPIPALLVKHIVVASFEALADVHDLADAQGSLDVVHGDISPDHVVFGPLGQVRFVDLGAARFRELETDVDTDDRGTVPYAAPEVVRGDVKPGQTSDVYALCATLLSFATGKDLCEASTDAARVAEVAAQGIRRDLVEFLPGFAPHERAVFRAALDPDPTQRMTGARRILDALRPPSPQRDIPEEAR